MQFGGRGTKAPMTYLERNVQYLGLLSKSYIYIHIICIHIFLSLCAFIYLCIHSYQTPPNHKDCEKEQNLGWTGCFRAESRPNIRAVPHLENSTWRLSPAASRYQEVNHLQMALENTCGDNTSRSAVCNLLSGPNRSIFCDLSVHFVTLPALSVGSSDC